MVDSQVALIVLVVLFVLGVVAVTLLQRKHRTTVWKRFARRRGLQYRETDDGPEAIGRVRGRAVRLHLAPESSDTGVMGVEQVEMEVDLSDRVPTDLRVEPTAELLSPQDDKTLASGPSVSTSPPRFRATVAADQEQPVTLSKSREAAIVRLASEFPNCDVYVSEGKLRLTQRTTGESVRELNRRLNALLRASENLSKPPPRMHG